MIEHTNKGSFRICIPKDWMNEFNAKFNNGKLAHFAKLEYSPDGSFRVIPIVYGAGKHGQDRFFGGFVTYCNDVDQ